FLPQRLGFWNSELLPFCLGRRRHLPVGPGKVIPVKREFLAPGTSIIEHHHAAGAYDRQLLLLEWVQPGDVHVSTHTAGEPHGGQGGIRNAVREVSFPGAANLLRQMISDEGEDY